MFELVHTSTRAGLIPGRSGYASVAWTEGMPSNLVAPVENLSAYRPLFAPDHPEAEKNPAAYVYRKLQYGAARLRIVSRVGFAGLDYTGRSNKIAHHLIFDRRTELDGTPGGALGVARHDENFFTRWEGASRLLPARRAEGEKWSVGPAHVWGRLIGDPGWAGVVAAKFREDPSRSINVEFSPDIAAGTILELIGEVLALLTPEEADDFTFSTYFFQTTVGEVVFFRAMLSGSPQLAGLRKLKPDTVISLLAASEVPAAYQDHPLVAAARSGTPPVRAAKSEVIHLGQPADSEMPAELRPDDTGDLLSPVPHPGQTHAGTAGFPEPLPITNDRDPLRPRRTVFFLLLLTAAALGVGAFVWLRGVRRHTPAPEPALCENLSEPEVAPAPKTPPKPANHTAPDRFERTGTPRPPAVAEPVSKPSPIRKKKKKTASARPAPVSSGALRTAEVPPKAPALSASERFDLFHQLLGGGYARRGTRVLNLPPVLRSTRRLEVELTGLGEISDPKKFRAADFILTSGARLWVCPARTELAEDGIGSRYVRERTLVESRALMLEADNGTLRIVEPELPDTRDNLVRPRFDNIRAIVFEGADGVKRVFRTGFQAGEYLPLLRSPKFRGRVYQATADAQMSLIYEPSPELRAVWPHVAVRVGRWTLPDKLDEQQLQLCSLSLGTFHKCREDLKLIRRSRDRLARERAEYHALIQKALSLPGKETFSGGNETLDRLFRTVLDPRTALAKRRAAFDELAAKHSGGTEQTRKALELVREHFDTCAVLLKECGDREESIRYQQADFDDNRKELERALQLTAEEQRAFAKRISAEHFSQDQFKAWLKEHISLKIDIRPRDTGSAHRYE